ncbi:MAG TPA: RsmB/NOP family class I SAM-dependent RNA methyltransferase [Deltaproteobacteria bacterium]|nr:RsmB/NOP family class I SAM-dependent RNA methyltransferase [Deltaproteobacteria bacterium]
MSTTPKVEHKMSDEKPNNSENLFEVYRDIIPDFDTFMDRIRKPLGNFIRVNTLRTNPKKMQDMLDSRGIKSRITRLGGYFLEIPGDIQPGILLEYHLGLFHPQTLTSGIPVLALDPKPDDLVLDLCAAPGGKTSHLAEVMKNTGLIVANDKNVSRLVSLRANLKRLGIVNTVVTMVRGEQFPLETVFPKILLDVPCSSEGRYLIGENGKVMYRTRIGKSLPQVQKQLMHRAMKLLAPGGILVYSTCTYNPDENESVIQYALDKFDVDVCKIDLDFPHENGLKEWKGIKYDRSIEKCWRIYPHRTDSVGFFVAKMVKR